VAEIIIVSLVIVTGCRICVSITPDFFCWVGATGEVYLAVEKCASQLC